MNFNPRYYIRKIRESAPREREKFWESTSVVAMLALAALAGVLGVGAVNRWQNNQLNEPSNKNVLKSKDVSSLLPPVEFKTSELKPYSCCPDVTYVHYGPVFK